jgi:diaminopimelate epimerase
MQIEIFKCHGSGNEFIMVDLVRVGEVPNMAAFAREMCHHPGVGTCDGVLFVVRQHKHYAMRMFNPDGSEAEMCGNGIRCVARLLHQRYILSREFTLASGKGLYDMREEEPMAENIKTYGVDIAVSLESPDFGFAQGEHIGKVIPSLDAELRFTALNLGNPHIVAEVENIDMERLTALGEKVKQLKDDFPRGINVSLYSKVGENAIFVATYERGAGITYSCGTAMTASATAASLLGICRKGKEIKVYNRGGMVRCLCRQPRKRITTSLIGNATYMWKGECGWDGVALSVGLDKQMYSDEQQAYEKFVGSLKK